MSIISKEELFNNEFNNYLNSKKRNIDYVNELILFAQRNNYLTNEEVDNIVLNLQTSIVKYILQNEKKSDYNTDIDTVRKNKSKKILYSINNYLIEKEPYESLSIIIHSDSLITDSLNYYNEYTSKLSKKIDELKKISNLEYISHIIYKTTIDKLDNKMKDFNYNFDSIEEYNDNNYIKIDYYWPLNHYLRGPVKDNSYLFQYEALIDDLTIEANILKKFDDKAIKNIITKLFILDDEYHGFANENYANNVCEHVLINYSLLSIYSDTPNNLEVSCNMYKVLANELNNGTIDKQELKNNIYNGKVKFSEEELEYINQHFIERSIEKETGKVVKDYILKLIK